MRFLTFESDIKEHYRDRVIAIKREYMQEMRSIAIEAEFEEWTKTVQDREMLKKMIEKKKKKIEKEEEEEEEAASKNAERRREQK